MQIKYKKLIATTLVELLAVLSILGVVAALTVPSLKKHSQKTEYAKLAQYAYTTLDGALSMAMDEDDTDPNGWGSGAQILKDRLQNKLVIGKSCIGKDVPNECFAKHVGYKSNTESTLSGDAVLMLSGVSFLGQSRIKVFFVDVNGTQMPNMLGVDTFSFVFKLADANCKDNDEYKTWKLCPRDTITVKLMGNSWTIKNW